MSTVCFEPTKGIYSVLAPNDLHIHAKNLSLGIQCTNQSIKQNVSN